MTSLLSLPSEVLIETFSYLRPRDIAACQRSCRQLNDTIVHSQLLRYLIRVGRSALHDPLLPGYTIPQRIEALEKWEASWRNLEMIERSGHIKYIVPCDSEITYPCIIREDFLIMINRYNAPWFAYVDLRTFEPEVEKDPWTKIANESWRYKEIRFEFSVEQDLVLVILSPPSLMPSMFIELHGISFSRGTPHPCVVSATIPTERGHEFIDAVIVGDRTILNISSRESQRIFLHHWKDGHVYLLREASKIAWSRYCVMLSRDMIALVERDSATLELCRIVEDPDGGALSLCTLVRLGLPPLTPGISTYYSHCIREGVPSYSDASPVVIEGRPRRRVPFHSSTDEGLVAVVVDIAVGPRHRESYGLRNLMIVTHLRTLVALATRKSPGVTFIPWDNWGPRVTASIDRPFDGYSEVLIGERLVILSHEKLLLLDFNSSRIRDTIRRTGNLSGHSVHVTTVKHRSVIPRKSQFKEDVVGELPYISVVKATSLARKRLTNYEEGLAALVWDVRGRLFSPSPVAPRH